MKVEPARATESFDGDYVRGYIMFLVAGVSVVSEDGTITEIKKTQTRIINSKGGLTYWTVEEARGIEALKDFPCDDTVIHASQLTLQSAKQGE